MANPGADQPSVHVSSTPTATAMVVGTFHMQPTDDMFHTEVDDLLGPKRQAEIRECVERLKHFRPTKVAVEVIVDEQEALGRQYRDYVAGTLELATNEVHQLGFRVAAELGHPQVHAVDWMEWRGSRGVGDVFQWAKKHQPSLFAELWRAVEAEQKSIGPGTATIIELLRQCNDPDAVAQSHKLYMNIARVGDGRDYVGIDWLRWWYERNLIIFANVARLVESPNDRILLLIGAAHVHLLSRFMEESGLFHVESADRYFS